LSQAKTTVLGTQVVARGFCSADAIREPRSEGAERARMRKLAVGTPTFRKEPFVCA
jgi:hypothetical protein